MRQHPLVLLIVILSVVFTVEADTDTAGGRADNTFSLLSGGAFETAIPHLRKRIRQNGPDSLSCYNLAVALEKTENPGEAVYYYLQALQGSRHFTEARNNLHQLTGKLHIDIPRVLRTPDNGLLLPMVLFFISVYLFSILLIFYMFRSTWKLRLALIPACIILLLFTGLFFTRYRAMKQEQFAVSLTQSSVRSGPDNALSELDTLKSGEVVRVTDSSGNWIKVQGFQNNIEGWVDGRKIRSIIRPAH